MLKRYFVLRTLVVCAAADSRAVAAAPRVVGLSEGLSKSKADLRTERGDIQFRRRMWNSKDKRKGEK